MLVAVVSVGAVAPAPANAGAVASAPANAGAVAPAPANAGAGLVQRWWCEGRALGCWKRQVCCGETFWRVQWVLIVICTKIFAFLVVKVLWNDVGDVACLWVNWLRCEVNGKIPKTF